MGFLKDNLGEMNIPARVTPGADLSITKSDAPDPVYVGRDLTYRIGITNNGPLPTTDVNMYDVLSADVTYVSASASKGTCTYSDPQVNCYIDAMDPGESLTVTIIVTPTKLGTINNVVMVNGAEYDPDLSNNTATQSTTVVPSADLSIIKTDLPDPLYIGENLTYTIAVTNSGPSPATGVSMVDTLPSGVTLVSVSPSKGSWSQQGNKVTCVLGAMDVNEQATVTIIVTPTVPGTITNNAGVSGTEYDPNPNNNTTAQSTSVLASADLTLTKTDLPDPLHLGEKLTYTIDVTNNGPWIATNVLMTDTLPAGVTLVSALSTKGACNQVGNQISCPIGTLTVTERVTITIVVIPTIPGIIANTATTNGNEYDPNLNNNTATQNTTVLASADLAISKTDSPDPLYLGENLTYLINITNNGLSPATGVTMTDLLPPGVNYISAIPTKGFCHYSENQITWEIDTLTVNEQVSATITVTPTVPGDLVNTADVHGNEYDPDITNNRATEHTTVLPSADLAITKNAPPHPIYLGDNLTYTLVVTNNGLSPATNVIMTDTLPSDVTYVYASSTKGICSQSGNQILCTIDNLDVRELSTITIVVTPTTPSTITNTAIVRGHEYDPHLNNNSITLDTTVLPAADLTITKTDLPDPVHLGENLTYTLVVTNQGLSPATEVVVIDTLPAGVTYVSTSSTKGSYHYAGGQVICTIGAMAVSESATITIIVTPTTPGIITNTATISGNEYDPNPNNNMANQNTTVLASADLAITKATSPNPVYVGKNLTYSVVVTNIGPSTATNVTMIDTLPSSITYVSATSTKGTCSYSVGKVTCQIDSLASGELATISIIVMPLIAETITNTANVTGNEYDPDPSNNTATQNTTVRGSADLAVTKTDSPDPVYVGQNLTYTIVITNNGPSLATGVNLFDILPTTTTFVSASSTKGVCNQTGSQVTCTIGQLAINELVTVTIMVIPTTSGSITNTAMVSGIEHDPKTSNNSASQNTTVLPPSADLAVTKSDFPDPIYVGENLSYTVLVTNHGPSLASNVTMIDTLPAGITYVSSASTKGSCSYSENKVTCAIGPLPVSELATITIVVRPDISGTITNTAIVDNIEYDPNLSNNTAIQDTIVLPSADLGITKTPSSQSSYVGENLTYTVVITNHGISPATGVTMIDTLPADITYLSAISTKGICHYSGNQVTCEIDTLSPMEVVTMTLIVVPNTPGIITNTATVRGLEYDPNPINNTATTNTTVLASADLIITKTDSPDPIHVEENLTYTMVITNMGPSSATDVVMIDDLPAGIAYVSASSTKGICSHSGSQVTCAIDGMTTNELVTITIRVTPTTPGLITNTASVASNEYDPDLSNNTATQNTNVLPGEKITLSSGVIQNLGMLHDGIYATDTTLFLLNTDPNNSYTVTVDLYDRNWWEPPLPLITNTLVVPPNHSNFLSLRLDFLPVYEIRVTYYHQVQSTCTDDSNDLLVVTSFGINNVNYDNIPGQTLLPDNFKKLRIPTPLFTQS